MNWKAIKHIYREVLISKDKIEYLGGDKYKIIRYYSSGAKRWETEYQNGKRHKKSIGWYKDGTKSWEEGYQNGQRLGDYISWRKDGTKFWEEEHLNGKRI